MGFELLTEETGAPFSGRKLDRLVSFLSQNDLRYEDGIEYSVVLSDQDGNICATGSMRANVLMCIAVAPSFRGDGLTARIITHLYNRAFSSGLRHLFLFTKPSNRMMFADLGFYEVISTDSILLMENTRNGIGNYLDSLTRPEKARCVGAVVANCNPFTEGHRYLIETALKECDALHLFILSEDRSMFSTEERMKRVKAGVSDLKNVYIHGTSDYLVSSATFPVYFIKDKAKAQDANCLLDILIFCELFAPALGISKRFVGTEPFDPVTRAYNEKMKEILPRYGLELVEVERLCRDGVPISASAVRRALQNSGSNI